MLSRGVRARRFLREWRLSQQPRVTQDDLGNYLGKTGALVRLFETGRVDLIRGDCIKLSRRTGIPLVEFLGAEEARRIHEASELLSQKASA